MSAGSFQSAAVLSLVGSAHCSVPAIKMPIVSQLDLVIALLKQLCCHE
jgi:hypothetical protein